MAAEVIRDRNPRKDLLRSDRSRTFLEMFFEESKGLSVLELAESVPQSRERRVLAINPLGLQGLNKNLSLSDRHKNVLHSVKDLEWWGLAPQSFSNSRQA